MRLGLNGGREKNIDAIVIATPYSAMGLSQRSVTKFSFKNATAVTAQRTTRTFAFETSEENKKAPQNATHPKTQEIDSSENLRFRVCCVFGCSLFPSKRAPKHTRKRNTLENTDFQSGQFSAFRACFAIFCACYRGHLGPSCPKSKKQPASSLSCLSLFLGKKKARKTT